jgi:class 3 adenylate cyclase
MAQARKTVTVVFADVSGSTALGERLDPEALRRVMERYFEEARTALERHGGAVEKFIGDAVVAVFGIPAAHEDDAMRAVRAAKDLRDAITRLNADLKREAEITLGVRTGINTGEVVAGDPSGASSTQREMLSMSPPASSRPPPPARSCWARRPSCSSGTWSRLSRLSS